MASLRLTFPEKDEPTVIALTGARLTIGRLPFNTIQIIDRTVSGFHAELISEHGHYRLHDRGSSNGTYVNGQKVADFHLTEACTIAFGTVEAQFSPEAIPASEDAENFPTRTEINAVRKENAELKATVEALREEAHALRSARPIENGDSGLAVSKEEFDKVVVERETLKEAQLKQDEEIARLKTDLAVLKRDRVNLQLAYDGLQRDITDLRAKAGGVEEVALPPKAAADALAAPLPEPGSEVRVEVPMSQLITGKTAMIPSPYARPPQAKPVAEEKKTDAIEGAESGAPAAEPSDSAPARPSAPSFPKPPASMPKPGIPGSTGMKPFAPLPKAPLPKAPAPAVPVPAATAAAKPVGSTLPPPSSFPKPGGVPVAAPQSAAPETPASETPVAPAAPVTPKAPIGLGTGIRPMGSKPPGSLPSAPAGNGHAGGPPKPSPSVKLPMQPTVKLPSVPAPVVGPKGTQKL